MRSDRQEAETEALLFSKLYENAEIREIWEFY